MSSENSLKFCTFYPNLRNVHLAKDVGKIPNTLGRDFGYQSKIASYCKEDYKDLESEASNTEIKKIPAVPILGHILRLLEKILGKTPTYLDKKIEIFRKGIESILFFVKNRDIDIIQFYGLGYESLVMGSIYRIINREAILYIKMDRGSQILEKDKETMNIPLYGFFLEKAKFNLISIETKQGLDFVKNEHPVLKNFENKIFYLPNGVDIDRLSEFKGKKQKRKNILHIGRIGKKQKGSDIVLDTFLSLSEEYEEWKLVLAGSMDQKFREKLENAISSEPEIGERIEYEGFVDKEKLYELYDTSEIIFFPSRWESFGIAALEGLYFENAILASRIDSLIDITKSGEFGYFCPVEEKNCFRKKLEYMLNNSKEIRKKSREASEFVEENYNWSLICEKLDGQIKKEL